MVLSRIASAFNFPGTASLSLPGGPQWTSDPTGTYRLLRYYYDSNGLYEHLNHLMPDRYVGAMKPLYNPTHRAVEFHVAHLWPELPDIDSDNQAIVDPIKKIWRWSNWEARSRVAARWFARDGDLFIKAVSVDPGDDEREEKRVYLQLIDAAHVVDFDVNDRGYVTYLHMEVPTHRRNAEGEQEDYIHIEKWDEDQFRRWEIDPYQRSDNLGPPAEMRPLSEFGIDFIPFVHAKFRDVGQLRGWACITHAIDKIDELNRLVTRLHQMQFRHNNVTWALQSNSVDAQNRPLPPPSILSGLNGAREPNEGSLVTMGDETFISLPGNASMHPLVPSLNYEQALTVATAMRKELERDIPELSFQGAFGDDEGVDLSGVAIRTLMTPSTDRVVEARTNGEQAIIRAQMMALTMGQYIGIPEFRGLGDFRSGSLDHTFGARDTIGISELEKAETVRTEAEAAIAQQRSGISIKETLRQRGYSDDQIAEMEMEREAEMLSATNRAQANLDAGAGFDFADLGGDASGDIKMMADAMGVLIRSGVDPEDAAARVGLDGLQFTGAVPALLRMPEQESRSLEER